MKTISHTESEFRQPSNSNDRSPSDPTPFKTKAVRFAAFVHFSRDVSTPVEGLNQDLATTGGEARGGN